MVAEIFKIPTGIYRFLFGDLSVWGALAISVILIFIYIIVNGKSIFSRIVQTLIILSIILMAKMYYRYQGLLPTIKFTIFISTVFFAPTIIKYLIKFGRTIFKALKTLKSRKKSDENNLKLMKLFITCKNIEEFLDPSQGQEEQKFIIKDLPFNKDNAVNSLGGGEKTDEEISR